MKPFHSFDYQLTYFSFPVVLYDEEQPQPQPALALEDGLRVQRFQAEIELISSS